MTQFHKNIYKIALPIMFEQVFVISLGMINTMMAGHIGKEAVSAIGMVDSLNNIFIAFFSALAVGGTVVVAQFIGQQNIRKANEALKQVLYSGILISLVITILIWVFRDSLIGILFGAAEKTVIKDAYIYLGITLLTYPLITMDLIGNGIIRGSGNTKTPMKITIFMNFVNVIMSYLFIYGINIKSELFHIDIPGMGIHGAAIGIAIARTTGAIIILIVLLRGTNTLRLRKLFNFRFNKELLNPIFSIGIPASIESLLFNGGKLITQIFIVSMGTASIASNAISASITNMLNVPGNALCTTAIVIVGQYMGRSKTKEAEHSLIYMTKMSTVFLAIVGIISIPLARPLALLYSNNSDILRITTHILHINAFAIVLWSISFVLPSGLKGAGDAKYTMFTSMIGMWVFRITLGYVLGIVLKLGLEGIWLGMYTDWLVRGSLYVLRFKGGKWKNLVVIKRETKAV